MLLPCSALGYCFYWESVAISSEFYEVFMWICFLAQRKDCYYYLVLQLQEKSRKHLVKAKFLEFISRMRQAGCILFLDLNDDKRIKLIQFRYLSIFYPCTILP